MLARIRFTSESSYHQFRSAINRAWSDKNLPRIKPDKGRERAFLPLMFGEITASDRTSLLWGMLKVPNRDGELYRGWVRWFVPGNRAEGVLWKARVEDLMILTAFSGRIDDDALLARLYDAIPEPSVEQPLMVAWPLIRKFGQEHGYYGPHVVGILNKLEKIYREYIKHSRQPPFGLDFSSSANTYMVDLQALVKNLESAGVPPSFIGGAKSRQLLREMLDDLRARRLAHSNI